MGKLIDDYEDLMGKELYFDEPYTTNVLLDVIAHALVVIADKMTEGDDESGES